MPKTHYPVYSTDPNANAECPKCRQIAEKCRCTSDLPVDFTKIVAVLSIEKGGRSGKSVTILSRLPTHESFLKKLLATLKQKCGAGGTYGTDAKRAGFLQIQGDQRERLRALLAAEGIRVKN